jgi:rubredoxin
MPDSGAQLSLFEDQDVMFQCPCCGAEGTLQDLINRRHLSLHDPRTFTGELVACLAQRLDAEAQARYWQYGHGPFPEEYTRLTTINPDGSRVIYTYEGFTDAPAREQPGWRCPTCGLVELSPARLAAHHGVLPGDRASWRRVRCWSTIGTPLTS